MSIKEALNECYLHYVSETNEAIHSKNSTKAQICLEIASLCNCLKDLIDK